MSRAIDESSQLNVALSRRGCPDHRRFETPDGQQTHDDPAIRRGGSRSHPSGRRASPFPRGSRPIEPEPGRTCDAVNQTSSPLGDHARPRAFAQPEERILFCLSRSTTATEPSRSSMPGWSRKAMSRPSREMRGWASRPLRCEKHRAQGKLQAAMTLHRSAHDRERRAVRRPIRLLDVVQDLAGRAAGQRGAGERAQPGEGDEPGSERQGQLPLEETPQKEGLRTAECSRFRISLPRGIELDRRSLPRRRVNDRLAVRHEPGGVHVAPAERQPLERSAMASGRPASPRNTLRRPTAASTTRRTSVRAGPAPGVLPCRPFASRRGSQARASPARRRGPRRSGTACRIFLQAAPDDRRKCRRHFDPAPGKRRRFLSQNRRHRLGLGATAERVLSRQHLVKDRAKAEEVRAVVHGLAAHLLGRHVAHRAEDRARLGQERQVRLRPRRPPPASRASRGRSRGSSPGRPSSGTRSPASGPGGRSPSRAPRRGAFAIWAATSTAFRAGSGPARSRSRSVSPSSSSMTRT